MLLLTITSNLLPENSYLLDTGNAVFVWNGRTTNVKKESAVEFANNYMKINNKPSYSSLSFVAMGVEPCLFRTHFTGISIFYSFQAFLLFFFNLFIL